MSVSKPRSHTACMSWLGAVLLLSLVSSALHFLAILTKRWFRIACGMADGLEPWNFHASLWSAHCSVRYNISQHSCFSLGVLLRVDVDSYDPSWVTGARFVLGCGVAATAIATALAAFLYIASTTMTRQMAVGLAGVQLAAGSLSSVALLCLQSGSFRLSRAMSERRCSTVTVAAGSSANVEVVATCVLLVTGAFTFLAGITSGLEEEPPKRKTRITCARQDPPEPGATAPPTAIENILYTSEV